MTPYEFLKSHGHSALKAAEISLDYTRGCKYAIAWLVVLGYVA